MSKPDSLNERIAGASGRALGACLRALLLVAAVAPSVAHAAGDPPAGVYVPEALSLGPDDEPEDLIELPSPPATREGLRLRADAWAALERMVGAAARDGIELRVVSAYRSFEYQKGLHARAVRRHGADQRWVAAPGTSEHQLGTTIDVADAALDHVLEPSFAETAEGTWVREHAARFGFVVSYTQANAEWTGYRPEPWHLRFRPETMDP